MGTIANITLQHGDAPDDCTKTRSFPNFGGAIRFGIEAATVTLTTTTVVSNTASLGGGLFNEGGLLISNSIFSGNRVTDGPIGAIDNTGTLTLTNSTIAYYSASTSAGGLTSRIDRSKGETLTVRNTLFARNVALMPVTSLNSRDCVSSDGDEPAGDIDASNLMGEGTCGSAIQSGQIYLGPLQDNGPSSAGSGTSSGQAPWTHALLPYGAGFNA